MNLLLDEHKFRTFSKSELLKAYVNNVSGDQKMRHIATANDNVNELCWKWFEVKCKGIDIC